MARVSVVRPLGKVVVMDWVLGGIDAMDHAGQGFSKGYAVRGYLKKRNCDHGNKSDRWPCRCLECLALVRPEDVEMKRGGSV